MKKSIAVSPGLLSGTITVPPSKSVVHRAIFCAALSSGESVISNIAQSEDIKATLGAAKILGATVKLTHDTASVSGINFKPLENVEIDCNESGSTLRFLVPIALAIGGKFSVSGKGRLMQRPLKDYFTICDRQGIQYEMRENRIFFEGSLKSDVFHLTGNVSSQYITGLLMALPLLSGDSEIVITTEVESRGYIDLTIEMMRMFGILITTNADYTHFYIPGNQVYRACNVTVEGDYSQAAFYLVANAIGSNVHILGLNSDSVQGDREILNVIQRMQENTPVRTIDVRQIPDLLPILSVLAAKVPGTTNLVGAARLRLKESDRLSSVTEELTKLGAKIKEFDDALEITGGCTFTGGHVDSHNDHRIAMSLAIAATTATGTVVIDGAESVNKSYADFWEKFAELGGVATWQQPTEISSK